MISTQIALCSLVTHLDLGYFKGSEPVFGISLSFGQWTEEAVTTGLGPRDQITEAQSTCLPPICPPQAPPVVRLFRSSLQQRMRCLFETCYIDFVSLHHTHCFPYVIFLSRHQDVTNACLLLAFLGRAYSESPPTEHSPSTCVITL